MQKRALLIGSLGQIGTELFPLLQTEYGSNNVYGLDIGYSDTSKFTIAGNALDKELIASIVKSNEITHIYHLAAILSATGEKNPILTWEVNVTGLQHILEIAKESKITVFWPSSIAAFGPSTPKDEVPQYTVMDPTTVYGITKVTGELLCQYYRIRYGVDVRSVRFPGIISYKTHPGGGTSDFAVEVFHAAKARCPYTSFVDRDTKVPMMYMNDALRAISELMKAPVENLSVTSSYNISGAHFSAQELYAEISKHIPIEVSYKPDFRQEIADSWPNSIDDSIALQDWGWKPQFSLKLLVKDMLEHLPHD